MWDFSPVAAMQGPLIAFLVSVLVISIVIAVGWFIAQSLRNGS